MFEFTFNLWLTALLESEAQSVLLDIKHPAIKKQVSKTDIHKHIYVNKLFNQISDWLTGPGVPFVQ